MSICMKCEKNETSCFSSCDNCKKGLCDICSDNLQSLIDERSYEYQIKCTICKTNFYEFCDFCQKYIICSIIIDKQMNKDTKNPSAYAKMRSECKDKSWSELSEDMKNNIGDPNEQVKKNHSCCSCDNYLHCYNKARTDIKNELGISNHVLYESGLDILLCKSCFLDKIGDLSQGNECD